MKTNWIILVIGVILIAIGIFMFSAGQVVGWFPTLITGIGFISIYWNEKFQKQKNGKIPKTEKW